MIFVDFETYSEADLREVGSYEYADHPSTRVMLLTTAVGLAGEPVAWDFVLGKLPPHLYEERIFDAIDRGERVVGHNIGSFDLRVWNCVAPRDELWHGPTLHPGQIEDTMARAAMMALPLSLENAAAAVGVAGKHAEGRRKLLKWARPRRKRDGTLTRWMPDTDKLRKEWLAIVDYGLQDIRVTQGIYARTQPLPEREARIWQLDLEINQRGIPVNVEDATRCVDLVVRESRRVQARVDDITGGEVASVKAPAQVKAWLWSRNVMVPDTRAETLRLALEGDLDDDVREFIAARIGGAQSSVAKFAKFCSWSRSTGRMRGTLVYHGASTGRWTGRGPQTQNLPRGMDLSPEMQDFVLSEVVPACAGSPSWMDALSLPVVPTLSSCARGLIAAPPGKLLASFDFGQIEARATAYLAGETDVLEAFRTGVPIYEYTAARLFHVPLDTVDKAMRLRGKVCVLALGYLGGVGALQSMGPTYGLYVSDTEAEKLVKDFRAARPGLVAYGKQLERACIEAVKLPGTTTRVGPVLFKKSGQFLMIRLPSGRVLYFPYAELVDEIAPWGDLVSNVRYKTVNEKNQWVWTHLWRGKILENVASAFCRDLLAEAMLRLALRPELLQIVMTVHDEIVCEFREQDREDAETFFRKSMLAGLQWAPSFPVEIDGWVGRRYRK